MDQGMDRGLDPEEEQTSEWSLVPGDEIVPGVHAWAFLGGGRRCEMWLGWCRDRWTAATVKLPRPGEVNEKTRTTLVDEAASVERCAHPSVQRLLAADTSAPLPYLVFEYIEGPTLAQLLEEEGRFSPSETVRFGMQVASVLRHVHRKGLVHLDVKPDNLVVREGRAVLMDFDLAAPMGYTPDRRGLRGSPPYMAPEQVEGAQATSTMDLFALGAVLYEAATDTPPFDIPEGVPWSEYPQLHGKPPPASELVPDIPPGLDRVISRLMEPDPQDRPARASEALELLALAVPDGDDTLWPEWATPLLREPVKHGVS